MFIDELEFALLEKLIREETVPEEDVFRVQNLERQGMVSLGADGFSAYLTELGKMILEQERAQKGFWWRLWFNFRIFFFGK